MMRYIALEEHFAIPELAGQWPSAWGPGGPWAAGWGRGDGLPAPGR